MPLDRQNIHSQVINVLQGSNHPLEKEIGVNLKRLNNQRKNCDYDKDRSFGEQDAQQAYIVATKVLRNLEKVGAV